MMCLDIHTYDILDWQ